LENRLRCRRTLHTTFLICIVLLLLDSQPPPPGDRHKELTNPVEEPVPSIEGAELLNDYYHSRPAPDVVYAHNASGTYRGMWRRAADAEQSPAEQEVGYGNTRSARSALTPLHVQLAKEQDVLDFSRSSGRAHLQLQMNSVPGVDGMSTVSGGLRLRDGMITTVQDVTLAVQGFVFHHTGRVLLKAVEELEDKVFVYLPNDAPHLNESYSLSEVDVTQSSFALDGARPNADSEADGRRFAARKLVERASMEGPYSDTFAGNGIDELMQGSDGLPLLEGGGAPHDLLAELVRHAWWKIGSYFSSPRGGTVGASEGGNPALRSRKLYDEALKALLAEKRKSDRAGEEEAATTIEDARGMLKIPIPTGVKGFPIDTNRAGVPCKLVISGEIRPFREKDPDSLKSMEKAPASSLLLTATSVPCGLQFNMTLTALRVDWKKASAKATNYSVTMTLASVLQIAALLKQLQHTNTQAAAARMSLLCIAMQALMDALLCILHLLLCVVIQSLFAAFASIAFFKLIIFCIFEMRYMVLIFQARQDQDFFAGGWAEIRRRLASLHAYFYGVLMALMVFIYLLNVFTPSAVPFVLLLGHSFWVPQIIENVRRESRTPLCRTYLATMSATRLIIPLYLYGCPANILNVFESKDPDIDGGDGSVSDTNAAFCVALVVWMGVQAGVLLLQEKLGPQFFVPAMFLPEKYNYRRPVPPENEGTDCVICMCELGGLDNVMVAPCGHAFHRDCLLRWMEERAECPVCRGPLPAP